MVALHLPIDDDIRNEFSEYDDLTAALLCRRGIKTAKEAETFFNPSYDEHLHDPMQMKNMPEVAARLAGAIDAGEYIAVWSDYDADGIPGGVILHDFLKKVGAHFTNYIPHRHLEGYGVNVSGIEKLASEGITLVITVDSGITDVTAIARAKELGMDVIVTDHHEPGEVLPDALVVIDPKQKDETYPFRDLCGAGLAWKLVVATLAHGFTGRENIPNGWEKWLLDMVGIATIADMVPLTGENRVLARYGLLVLRKSPRVGLVALCRAMRTTQRTLTEDDVGFMIAPRINAASRMSDPMDAFLLLATDDDDEASMLAKKLEAANRRRRSAAAAITRAVHARILARGPRENLPSVLAMGDSEWSPALLGLVAGGIAEEYGKPVFLWGRGTTQALKGSCRSEGKTRVLDLMNAAGDTFLQCGGHVASGGFTINPDAVFTFEERLIKAHEKTHKEESKSEEILGDAEIKIEDATGALVTRLEQFAPFGEGNSKPAWILRKVKIQKVSWFGKNQEHLRLSVLQGRGTIEAIAFFVKHDLRTRAKKLVAPSSVTLLAYVERDTFLQRNTIRLRILQLV